LVGTIVALINFALSRHCSRFSFCNGYIYKNHGSSRSIKSTVGRLYIGKDKFSV